MRPAYDLIVFDWDGTLFDSVGWIVDCIQRAALASDRAVPSEQAARSVIGLSLQQAMAALYPGSNEVEMQRFVATTAPSTTRPRALPCRSSRACRSC